MTSLDAAWAGVRFLTDASLLVAIAGVGIFGWHFVRTSGDAVEADAKEISSLAWRGRGALLGLKVLACGAALQVAAILLSAVLPSRP